MTVLIELSLPPLIARFTEGLEACIYSTSALCHLFANAQTVARSVACPFLSAVGVLHDFARHATSPFLPALDEIRNATKDVAVPLLFVLAVVFNVAKDPE